MQVTQIHIVGYGKMGRAIERLAPSHGCTTSSIITSHRELLQSLRTDSDGVYIDFSSPHTILDNLRAYATHGATAVCGTTGWHNSAEELFTLFRTGNSSLLYASNFSFGMHLCRQLTRRMAAFSRLSDGARVQISETHHTSKLDTPSGTAISLAGDVIDHSAYTEWVLDGDDTSTHLPVRAIREGDAKGLHEITLDLPGERITLTHDASTRDVFAIGALQGARWVQGKSGVHTIDDMMQDLL